MKKFTVRDLAELSIVAAIYVVLTVALTPLSYGDVQFRLSEALMLLIIYKRKYAISLILGCFVANLFSPVGWVDIIFGTLATVVASIPMLFIKKMELASIFPSIANGIIVGIELALVYELPLPITMAQVFIGEFVVVSLVGIPLFKSLEKNEGFMKAIGCEIDQSRKNLINSYLSLSLAINIVSLIFFFKLSLNKIDEENDVIADTLFNQVAHEGSYYGIALLLIAFVSFMAILLLKDKLGLIFELVIAALFIFVFMFIVVKYYGKPVPSFYLYLIVPISYIIMAFIRYFKTKKEEALTAEDSYE